MNEITNPNFSISFRLDNEPKKKLFKKATKEEKKEREKKVHSAITRHDNVLTPTGYDHFVRKLEV